MSNKKIPKHAKRVFHGEVFDIYQAKLKMFDGSVRNFEWAKTLDGAGVIATVGNKIVILKQKQPGIDWYYSLPGGYLDHPKEAPVKGAMRELLEETGLKPAKTKYWKTFLGYGRLESQYHVYIAQNCTKVAEQNLDSGGEIIEVKLFTFEQFLMFSENPHFKGHEIVKELLLARLSKKRLSELRKLIFN